MQRENFLQIVFRFQFQVIKILQCEKLLNTSVYLLLNITCRKRQFNKLQLVASCRQDLGIAC